MCSVTASPVRQSQPALGCAGAGVLARSRDVEVTCASLFNAKGFGSLDEFYLAV